MVFKKRPAHLLMLDLFDSLDEPLGPSPLHDLILLPDLEQMHLIFIQQVLHRLKCFVLFGVVVLVPPNQKEKRREQKEVDRVAQENDRALAHVGCEYDRPPINIDIKHLIGPKHWRLIHLLLSYCFIVCNRKSRR